MEERLTPESRTDGGGGSARRRSSRWSLPFGPVGNYVIDLLSGSAYFNTRTCAPYDISDFVDRLPILATLVFTQRKAARARRIPNAAASTRRISIPNRL